MSTTSIRLSDELKQRVAEAAQRYGVSANKYIVDAIAEKTDADERRADFEAEADRRWARIVETGETIAWADMRQYLKDRIAGRPAQQPKPRKLV